MNPCQLLSASSGIEDPKPINIFPNPTKNILQISAEEKEIKSIRIYSVTGEFISEVINTHTIETGTLPGGIYLIEIALESGGRRIKKN